MSLSADGRTRGMLYVLCAFVAAAAGFHLAGIGPRLLSVERYLPHGVCYTWQSDLMRLHLVSDTLIGLAYVSIPITLAYFIRRRTDLPFNWMFVLFGIFIVACGATHWMEVWTLWYPHYWLSGAVKAVTAAASVPTAVLLVALVPKALAIPSAAQLRHAKEALEREVAERVRTQEALQTAHANLEERVRERTAALAQANAELERQRAELEALNARLFEADRRKDAFLATLAHELRNPLAPVRNSVVLLKMKPIADPQLAWARDVIDRQVDHMARLLDDLLDVSRITNDRLELRKQTVPLERLIDAAVETSRPLIESAAHELTVSLPEERVELYADPVRLAQVFGNLLNNAAKYTPRGGRIDLLAERGTDALVVTIRDNGVGIAPDQLPHVFDMFTQVRSALNGDQTGLGIGLSLARALVRMHGGEVTVQSNGIGTGSVFTVRLPLDAAGSTGSGGV